MHLWTGKASQTRLSGEMAMRRPHPKYLTMFVALLAAVQLFCACLMPLGATATAEPPAIAMTGASHGGACDAHHGSEDDGERDVCPHCDLAAAFIQTATPEFQSVNTTAPSDPVFHLDRFSIAEEDSGIVRAMPARWHDPPNLSLAGLSPVSLRVKLLN